MAIKKDIVTRTGSVAGYWKIKRRNVDDITGNVEVALYGYRNRAHRDNYPNDPEDTRVINMTKVFTNDGTRAEVYAETVVSKPQIVTITEAIPAVVDEEGTVITPEVAAVTEEVETNEFAGAEEI